MGKGVVRVSSATGHNKSQAWPGFFIMVLEGTNEVLRSKNSLVTLGVTLSPLPELHVPKEPFDVPVERFLVSQSFESKGKLYDLGLGIDINTLKLSD